MIGVAVDLVQGGGPGALDAALDVAAVPAQFVDDDPIVTNVDADALVDAVVRIAGFALLSAVVALCVALVFRWYSDEEVPEGVAILPSVAVVAIWLNTKTALQDAILGTTPLLDPATAVYTVATFAVSAIAADGGRRLGDRLATDVFVAATPRTVDEVSQLVRSAGRVLAVSLPEEIEDADGYDPVDPETKAALAGETLLFPRRLAVVDLRARLVDRLERDYGVGYVDVDLAPDGEVDRLAVGSLPAGIGPSLAPGSVAVALRADPAADASPGDAVSIWTTGDGAARRLAPGELRATADDAVTVALDREDAAALEPDRSYRLVTEPDGRGSSRAFVSVLRAADEVVTRVPLGDGDPLAGTAVGSVPALVLVVERGEAATALPDADFVLERDDVAYLLGRPAELRRLGER